jgi:hypothetical protein
MTFKPRKKNELFEMIKHQQKAASHSGQNGDAADKQSIQAGFYIYTPKDINEIVGSWGYYCFGEWIREFVFMRNARGSVGSRNAGNFHYDFIWHFDIPGRIYQVAFYNYDYDPPAPPRYFRFGESKDVLTEVDKNGIPIKNAQIFIRETEQLILPI